MDNEVDCLCEQIAEYMGKISSHTLTAEFLKLMEAVSDLENIGDTIGTNMVVLGNERISSGVSISDTTKNMLSGFNQVVFKAVNSAVQAVSQNNKEVALTVIGMKSEIDNLANSAAIHQAQRLVANEPNRIPAYTIEMDIIEKQKRIYYFAKRMAKSVISEPAET